MSEQDVSNTFCLTVAVVENPTIIQVMEISDLSRAILRELQRDSTLSLTDLSQIVGAAQSTVWRRVQELETSGILRARVALLDARKVDARLCVFASVSLADHSQEALDTFANIVKRNPQILEAHMLSGSADYILRIRCADVEAYEEFMSHNLLRSPVVRSVVSSFSLKELKYTTELPL